MGSLDLSRGPIKIPASSSRAGSGRCGSQSLCVDALYFPWRGRPNPTSRRATILRAKPPDPVSVTIRSSCRLSGVIIGRRSGTFGQLTGQRDDSRQCRGPDLAQERGHLWLLDRQGDGASGSSLAPLLRSGASACQRPDRPPSLPGFILSAAGPPGHVVHRTLRERALGRSLGVAGYNFLYCIKKCGNAYQGILSTLLWVP
jgi:hypothetical protein